MTFRNPRAVMRDVIAACRAADLGAPATLLVVAAWARTDPKRDWSDWSVRQLADDAALWYGDARGYWRRAVDAGLIVSKPAGPGRAAPWQMGDAAAILARTVDNAEPRGISRGVTHPQPRGKSRAHPAENPAHPPRKIPRTQAINRPLTDQKALRARPETPSAVQPALPGVDDLADPRNAARQALLAADAVAERAYLERMRGSR